MKFLDELYYGNIRPTDRKFVRNSEYDKALTVCYDCETELNKKALTVCYDCETELNKKDDKETVELVNKLINSHSELMDIASLENFKIGFRLGVRMMCDVFLDESDVFKNITDEE